MTLFSYELAKIRRLSYRYVRVKLASKILQQEIERYREAHQDPVLKIASGYFADLTLGSFAGLRTDVNDKGEPVLVGLRPDDARTQATLQALADLSEKTEVILFTHHSRIVDQAQKIKNGTVRIHEL